MCTLEGKVRYHEAAVCFLISRPSGHKHNSVNCIPIGQQPLPGYSQGNVCSFHTGVVVGPCGDAAESNCSEPMVEAQC